MPTRISALLQEWQNTAQLFNAQAVCLRGCQTTAVTGINGKESNKLGDLPAEGPQTTPMHRSQLVIVVPRRTSRSCGTTDQIPARSLHSYRV